MIGLTEWPALTVNLGQLSTSILSSGMDILLSGSGSNILESIEFNSGEIGKICCRKLGFLR